MLTRFTLDPAQEVYPLWTPDASRIVFSSQREGPFNLYWKSVNGSGPVERLISSQNHQFPQSFSSDGKQLIVREDDPETQSDLLVLSMEEERRVQNLLRTPYIEVNAEISPDGTWFAYQSNESGELEIYIKPFSNPESERWKVSTNGGVQPLWNRNGQELYYIEGTNRMMAVSVQTQPNLEVQRPTLLFEQQFSLGPTGRTYDLSADGKRFLMIRENQPADTTVARITIVLNWFKELKERIPAE
jgi:Tol biopolymer transport system component